MTCDKSSVVQAKSTANLGDDGVHNDMPEPLTQICMGGRLKMAVLVPVAEVDVTVAVTDV